MTEYGDYGNIAFEHLNDMNVPVNIDVGQHDDGTLYFESQVYMPNRERLAEGRVSTTFRTVEDLRAALLQVREIYLAALLTVDDIIRDGEGTLRCWEKPLNASMRVETSGQAVCIKRPGAPMFCFGVGKRISAKNVANELEEILQLVPPAPATSIGAPVKMLLMCPSCGKRHVDEGEWAEKPHHTHACQHCGCVWRPAVEHTIGVRFLDGFKDEPAPPTALATAEPPPEVRGVTNESLKDLLHGLRSRRDRANQALGWSSRDSRVSKLGDLIDALECALTHDRDNT